MERKNESQFNKAAIIKRYINIFVVLAALILSLAIISNSMTKPFGHDEEMYCTGAYLMAQGKMIYRDFSYVSQMPCHPLLYAAVYKITGTTHYLLTGRLISAICDILVMISIVGIYRYVFKSSIITGTLFGLGAAVVYIFNPLVDYANGYAWNHDVVILCVMLALWLFILTDFKQISSFWLTACMGALLTFAACMRITTVFIIFLFLIILLSVPAGSIKLRLKTVLPFLAASCLVLIWPLWVIAHAYKAFYLNLVKIPALNGRWLHDIGMVYNKFGLLFNSLTIPGYFILLALAIFLWIAIVVLRGNLKIQDKSEVLLCAFLPVVFFVIAFIPPTMWKQYLAMPVPFILTGLAFPFLYLHEKASAASTRKFYKTGIVFFVICVLVSVVSYPVVLYRVPAILVPEVWTPTELHKISKDIADEITEPKLVMTLAPLLAIEGGCDIYTELSCGPFVYRVADFLSPEEQRITHTIGSKTLSGLISQRPPSAVITGMEVEALEKPLIDSANELNLRKKVYENGPTVYFRPGSGRF